MTMASAFLLLASAALSPHPQPMTLECSFTGDDMTSPDQIGPRRLGLVLNPFSAVSISVDDPTGIFTSGNVVASFSTRGGGQIRAAPRPEDPRWRAIVEDGQITLTGTGRNVTLAGDPPASGNWSGRLHYEMSGAGGFRIVKDGALTCRSMHAAEGTRQ
jgi:hypothetical protein